MAAALIEAAAQDTGLLVERAVGLLRAG